MNEPFEYRLKSKSALPAMQFIGGARSALAISLWLMRYKRTVGWERGYPGNSEKIIISNVFGDKFPVYVDEWIMPYDSEGVYFSFIPADEFEELYEQVPDMEKEST